MTRESLLALRKPQNRDHPSLRWGQNIHIRYCRGSWPELFYGDDKNVDKIVNQLIIDYQL